MSIPYLDDQRISDLEGAFGSLKLKSVSGKNVQFLDLDISIDGLTRTLLFKVYFKPTNTFCYLHIDSNHKNTIFKNIIKTVFIRLRRICTRFNDFIYFTSIITKQLLNRGYELTTINKVFNMVSRLDRKELLIYKGKKSIDFNNNFIFKIKYDSNLANQEYILKKAFQNFKNNENHKFSETDLTLVNSCQLNISSILVHNFKFPFIHKNKYFKCDLDVCNICRFSNDKFHFLNLNNYILPFFDNSSCDSLNVIYIIHCNICNCYYIGQTKNIKERLYNHIHSIKKFIPFNNCTVVSNHFNLINHNFYNNFSFFIVKRDVDDLVTRLKLEAFIINLFKKLNINIINDHIPNL